MPTLDVLSRLLLWLVVGCAAAGIGRIVTRSKLAGLPRLAWDTAAGLPVLLALFLALGQIPGFFAAGPLVALVVSCVLLACFLGGVGPGDAEPDPFPGGAPLRVTVAILALVLVTGFVWDRVPATYFDSLAYHYAQPNLWIVNGRLAPEAWSIHSWSPPGMSVLFGLGLACVGEAAASDANLIVGLLLLALAADFSRRLWGPAAAPLAAGFLLTLPISIHALGIPAADLGHGMFAFGSLAAGILAWKERDPAWLWRASLLAGGALQTKWLGVIVPFALLVALLLVRERDRPKRAAALTSVPVLLVAPWLVANAFALGNPVAPVLSSAIPTAGLAPGAGAEWVVHARAGLPHADDLERLWPRVVTGDAEEDSIYPTPAWGWVPLLLLPAGLLLTREERFARIVSALGLATLLIWLLTFRWERFLVATSALLAAACAGLVLALWRKRGALRVLPLAAAVLALLAAVRAVLSVLAFTGGAAVALGRENPRAWVERGMPLMRVFAAANAALDPRRDRVLLVGEDRHHRLDVPHEAPSLFNVHPLAEALAAGLSPEEALDLLRAQGFTHLIVDRARALRSAERYPSLAVLRGRADLLDDTLRALGPPRFESDGVFLFDLSD
jgi:hypothetical protein